MNKQKDGKNVLNYRVIIEKERQEDGTETYSAHVPTLGVFDYGDSIDRVLMGVKDGVENTVEFLTKEGREIPIDHPKESIVTFAEIKVSPKSARLISA